MPHRAVGGAQSSGRSKRLRRFLAAVAASMALLVVIDGMALAVVAEAQAQEEAPGAFEGLGAVEGRAGADPSALPGEPSPAATGEVESEVGEFYPPAGEAPPGDWEPEAEGFVEGESVVVEEKTTETRLVWRNPDGSYTEEQATSPVRFRDSAGRWRTYDEDLKARNGRLVPEAAPSGESIAAVADSPSVVQAVTDAGVVKLAQPDAEPVRGEVDGNEVVYPGAVDGETDLVVSLVPDGFETTLVVADAAPGNDIFEQVLTLPAGVQARDGGPGVELVDPRGEVVGVYGSGSAYDSAGQPAEATVRTRLVGQEGANATVEVSVDSDWLEDPDRVFPVSIDPTFTQTTGASGNLDTFVQSNITSTPQSAASELKIGKIYGDTPVRRGLLRFDTSSIVGPGNVVVDATLKLWNHYSPSCTAKTMQVRSLAEPFDANTVWPNRPDFGGTNITVPAFAKGYSGCAEGWHDIDIKTLAQKWAEGNTNHGIGLQASNESDNLGGKYFRSAESWVPPTLVITYNRQPVNGTLNTPADAAAVYTTQPKLTVNAGSDPDGDELRYWFSVSTNPDGTGQIISSGWLDVDVREWTVPAGSLLDGSTYYWTAYTWDGVTWRKDPPTPRSFTVDYRLGDSGAWPFDEHGPAKVNLATGNLVLSTASPSFTTVGGGMGVSYTYNSQASPITGWTGRYYSTFESTTKRPAAGQEPAMVRRDTTASFDWKAGAIAPGLPVNNTYATWSGYVRVPTAGGYKLGGLCETPETPSNPNRDDATGGVKVTFAGVVQDSWGACNPKPGDPWTPTVTLTAGQAVPVTIEYWTGTGEASLNLKVRGPGLPAGVNGGINLPADWMATTAPALPQGWNLSADIDGASTYRQALITQDAVTFVDTEETSHRYRWDTVKKSYVAPTGEYGTVARSNAGAVTLIDADGTTHVFGTDGRLLSVTSALDDTNRAAAQMTWSGDPLRLTEITDPVSTRKITLRYSGDGGCPTSPPSGLAAAPGGMVCELDYADFDAGTTELWYNANGQLARIVDPGNEVTDFAYDSNGRLAKARDPLAADAVASTLRADDESTFARFFYWTNKVASIELPEPMAGEDRPIHNYAYSSTTSTFVYAAGLATTTGKLREVTLDAKGRATTDTDQGGRSTVTVYDTQDRVVSTRDTATGFKSTSVYDAFGNLTDEWGPAPAAWWSSPDAAGAPTTANLANTPREVTRYDEGINTLAATWWDNPDLSGTPAARATGVAAAGLTNSSAKEIYQSWGTGGPPELGGGTRDFSGRLTGYVNLPSSATRDLRVSSLAGKLRVLIDNQLVLDAWDPGATTIEQTFTPASAGWKPIVVEYSNPSGNAGFDLSWRQSGGTYARVPASALNPGYGLETSGTDADGATSTTSYTDATANLGPEDGLATSTVTDDGGNDYQATTTYETTGYRRETSSTLPTGAPSTTTTAYYGSTDTRNLTEICGTGGTAVNQGGLAKTVTNPAPRTGPAIVNETVYDSQGRIAATRIVSDGDNWTCTSYDERGRTIQTVIPTLGDRPGRTTTYSYALLGNPLVSIIADDGPGDDDAGTGELVDLLGRTRAYQDANGQVTTTTYDLPGRVTQVNSPVGIETITYNLDGTTGPTVLDGQTLATPHYDSAGRLDWVEYANGVRSEPAVRDNLGRENAVVWKRTSDNTVLASNTVTRRLGGEIIDETVDGHDANPTGPNYVYDTSGRLTDAYTTARGTGGTLSTVRTRYGFATADASCPSGTRANAGSNTNRTSRTVGEGGGAAVYQYCYDDADRLVSATETGVGTIAYDNHGNTTSIWGETRSYDASDRHSGTAKGSTEVTYSRDPAGRVITRSATGEPTQRYGFTGETDSPDLILDGSGNVTQKIIGLPGGGLLTRGGGNSTWSLPNVHGDIVVTTDDTATLQGQAKTYDAFGVTTGTALPDNAEGAFDYGWLGEHQRPTEHADDLAATIEMGARQYDPLLGRFLEVDPVEGGSANDYDYANADPRNQYDLDGTWCGWGCMKKKARKLASKAYNSRAGRWVRKHKESIALGLSVAGYLGCVVCGVVATGYYAYSTARSCGKRQWGSCALGVASLGYSSKASVFRQGAKRLGKRSNRWAARAWGLRKRYAPRLANRARSWNRVAKRSSRRSIYISGVGYGYTCRRRWC